MFSRILRWLGLGARRTPKSRRQGRPPSATGHLFDKKPVKPKTGANQGAADDDFNPYNTGKFDRSASWEKISKKHR